MLKCYYIIILVFVISSVSAQPDVLINLKAQFIRVDNQGNVYLINATNVSKCNSQGELLYQYANALLGNISDIDVSNPLSILVFYKESNVLVFLNHQMAEISEPIELNEILDVDAVVASNSVSGGFWIFDALSMSLKGINNQRVVQVQSENLANFLKNETPTYLFESNQQVYLQTPLTVLVFDVYGNYLKQMPVPSQTKISINNQQLSYFNSGELFTINEVTFEHSKLSFDNLGVLLYAQQVKDKLYLHYPDKVLIKTIKAANND